MFVINSSFILLLSVTVIRSVNIRQRDLQSIIADKNLLVMIEDENKAQYLEQNFNQNTYKFGYEVGSDGQFHHENRGPNGVTYGCYGHVDPNKNLQATHYVADSYGYRVVEPNDPIIVYRQLNNDDVTKEVQTWSESHFPRGCGNFVSSFRFPASLSTTNGNELGNIGQSNKPDHITLDVYGKPVNVNYNSYGGFNSKKVNSYDFSAYKVNNKPAKKFDRTRITFHHNNEKTYFDNSDSTKLMKNGVQQVQVASNYQAGQNDNWSLRKNDKQIVNKHKNNILSILNDSEDEVLPISKKPYSNNLVVLTGHNVYKINDNMKYSKGVRPNLSANNKIVENYNIKTNTDSHSKFIVKTPNNDNYKYGDNTNYLPSSEYTQNGDKSSFFSNTDNRMEVNNKFVLGDKKTGEMSQYQNGIKNGEISNDNFDNYNNQFGNKIKGYSKIVDNGKNISKNEQNLYNLKSNLRPLATQTDRTPVKVFDLGGDVSINLKPSVNLTGSPYVTVFDKSDQKHAVYLGGDVSVNLKPSINLTGSPYVTVFDKNDNYGDNRHEVYFGDDLSVNSKRPVNLTTSPLVTVFDQNIDGNDNSEELNFENASIVNNYDNQSQTTVNYYEENENAETVDNNNDNNVLLPATDSNLNVGSTVSSTNAAFNDLSVGNDKGLYKPVVDIPLELKIKSPHITTIDKWFNTIKYSEHDGVQPQLPPEMNNWTSSKNDEIVEIKPLTNDDFNVTGKPDVGCNVLCLQQNFKFLNKTILWNSLNQLTNMKSNETELNAIQKVILLQPIVLLPYCQDENDAKLFDLNAFIPLLQNQSYAKIPYECARCNKSDL